MSLSVPSAQQRWLCLWGRAAACARDTQSNKLALFFWEEIGHCMHLAAQVGACQVLRARYACLQVNAAAKTEAVEVLQAMQRTAAEVKHELEQRQSTHVASEPAGTPSQGLSVADGEASNEVSCSLLVCRDELPYSDPEQPEPCAVLHLLIGDWYGGFFCLCNGSYLAADCLHCEQAGSLRPMLNDGEDLIG